MQTANYIMGLDLGTNSIGWALLSLDGDGKPAGYLDGGVRIFPRAVEDKTPTPKNAKRRGKRLARRLIERRARRRQRLENFLIKKDLLPEAVRDSAQREKVLNTLGDPYQLRAKALDDDLAKHELGRILLHLAQRRGFQSNRKTLLKELIDDPDAADLIEELDQDEKGDLDAEESAFKHSIAQLAQAIHRANKRTLGEYLASLDGDTCRRNRKHVPEDLRTSRQMYREEFALIRERQAAPFAEVLSDADWDQIEHIIFYQRPLRFRADRLGKCEFEPKYNRAHRARLEFQRFRYLQDINNLQYFEGHVGGYLRLSDEQRSKLINALEHAPELSWAKARKAVGLDRTQKFNLENSEVKKLSGNRTACAIRRVIGEAWDHMPPGQQSLLVDDLITIKNKKTLKNRLVNHWQFPTTDAVRLAVLELEADHGSLSLKAMRRILPHLEAGKIYTDALQAAGYRMRAQKVAQDDIVDYLATPPETRNPVVNKALHELRKLVNAIIRRHGKPAAIRLEMARELKMNRRQLAAYNKQQAANTKANDEAREHFQAIHAGQRAKRDDQIKYRLWKDQDGCCAYSGRPISKTELFSDAVEMDHILPYSQSLDDSYINKVICLAGENRSKGNRTPWQAFSGDAQRWEQIVQRSKSWADKGRALKAKADRMLRQGDLEGLDDFINSQLTDTRYISRVALGYLKPLGTDVSVVKGQITAWLRHIWGLHQILGSADEKNRTDHRHHLIDAAVVALTDRRLYHGMAKLAQRADVHGPDDIHIDPPWASFAQDTDALVKKTIVSHVPAWRLRGALHEDTASGVLVEKDGKVHTVYRKLLDGSIKKKDIDAIIDPTVQQAVRAHLDKHQGDSKAAFTPDNPVLHPNGSRIRRVRVKRASFRNLDALAEEQLPVRDKNERPFRYMVYGNTHHVEVFRDIQSPRIKTRFVTMLEAAQRARQVNGVKQPILDTHLDDKHAYVTALAINDMVKLKDGRVYRIQKLEKDSGRATLRLHSDATTESGDRVVRKSISALLNEMGLEKLAINRMGHIMP